MKKMLFPMIVLIIIVVAGIAIYASTRGEEKSDNNSSDNENPIAILFYGDTCPHCKTVNEWLEENNVSEKVKFDHLEIYKNKDNNALLGKKADSCGLNVDSVGVPFLYDIENNKCMSGADKVIDFFKSKI